MDLYQIYAEPCPHCGNTTQPSDIMRDRDGYNCLYRCCATWEAAYWANPRRPGPAEL